MQRFIELLYLFYPMVTSSHFLYYISWVKFASRSVSFHISVLFLLCIYSITTSMCMCNYMQEVNSIFVQYCVHSFPRKHEAGVSFYTQKTLSVTWALTFYLPGKSCLLSNCFAFWKVTDWKQKLTFPVSYMNL